MKKIILFLTVLLLSCSFANAANITFLNDNYELKQVQKEKSNYINEYESSKNKLDKIVVSYLPKEEDEFGYINQFISEIAEKQNLNMITFHPEANTFSYVVITLKKDNCFVDYHVIKCKAAKKHGVNAINFTHRYEFNDKASSHKAYEDCFKNNMKYVDAIVKTEIPIIVKK